MRDDSQSVSSVPSVDKRVRSLLSTDFADFADVGKEKRMKRKRDWRRAEPPIVEDVGKAEAIIWGAWLVAAFAAGLALAKILELLGVG